MWCLDLWCVWHIETWGRIETRFVCKTHDVFTELDARFATAGVQYNERLPNGWRLNMMSWNHRAWAERKTQQCWGRSPFLLVWWWKRRKASYRLACRYSAVVSGQMFVLHMGRGSCTVARQRGNLLLVRLWARITVAGYWCTILVYCTEQTSCFSMQTRSH